MKKNISIAMMALALSGTSLTSCIEETEPMSVLTSEQLSSMASSQEGMLNGIIGYMVAVNSWGTSYYANDWGYPCQMFFRDLLLADIPCYNSTYNYWVSTEEASENRYTPYYTYRFYYDLIHNINNLIGVIDPQTDNVTSRHYLGCALGYRAMCYLDIARMFEYKECGIADVDAIAQENDIWGLTIPIVTPEMTVQETKNNPRAPFYRMYRFIYTDLCEAETYLKGFTPSEKTLPSLQAIYGLKARFFLELGTRFDNNHADLEKQIMADKETGEGYEGYLPVGVTSAADCYRLAKENAEMAMVGHSFMTADECQSETTGFNTPVSSWLWCVTTGSKEQLSAYYWTFNGTITTEPDYSMARAYNAYRMIGSKLFGSIYKSDIRRPLWIAPEDAGKAPDRSYYRTILSDDEFKEIPAYVNLKFRPAQGDKTSYEIGLLTSIPLMRIEEMEFIKMECMARLGDIAGASNELKNWMNTYRVTNKDFDPWSGTAYDLTDFLDKMMVQKRIEFWGEGICYFDYKRMNLQVRRKDNTNYESNYLINSKPGYCAPWFSYYILEYEIGINTAVIPNPDTSGCISTSDEY